VHNGELRWCAHLPFVGLEPVGGWTTKSVTHGQCNARPTVTFPALEHHHPLTGTVCWQQYTGVSSLPKATAQWCWGRTIIASLMPTDSATITHIYVLWWQSYVCLEARGRIIRTVLHCIVCWSCTQSSAHLDE